MLFVAIVFFTKPASSPAKLEIKKASLAEHAEDAELPQEL
jgi:hypothetical protein